MPFIGWREDGYRKVPHREGYVLILYNKNVKITSNSASLKINLNYAIAKTYFNIINLQI